MAKQKQEPQDDTNVERIGHLVSLLERLLRRELSEALSVLNLTVPQYAALMILGNNNDVSNAKLAKLSFMTPQSTNEMVGAMEAKSLVMREPDANHGRIINIRITKEGKRALRKADAAVLEIEKSMLGPIPEKDRKKFRDQLIACILALKVPLPIDSPLDAIPKR